MPSCLMAWTPPPLDPAPYGRELAERVAAQLEAGHELTYAHRDYCGMGLRHWDGQYLYGEVYDASLRPLEDLQAMTDPSAYRYFQKREDFIVWLADQSDLSLARLESPDEFSQRNQTIDRERLMKWLAPYEATSHVTLQRWKRLWSRLDGEYPEGWFGGVICAYQEGHRHYHNLRHIQHCLEEFDMVASLVKQPAVLEMALWTHDLIYDPEQLPNNEERSAEFAADILNDGGVSKSIVKQIGALIMVTRSHEPDRTPDAEWMCDIDLAILGQNEQRFWEYEAAIRAEYEWVPKATYAKKRAAILQRFLDRPFLYQTEFFRERYEVTARRNLAASVARLEASGGKRSGGLLKRWLGK